MDAWHVNDTIQLGFLSIIFIKEKFTLKIFIKCLLWVGLAYDYYAASSFHDIDAFDGDDHKIINDELYKNIRRLSSAFSGAASSQK